MSSKVNDNDVALFAPFAGADPNSHPCTVDVDGPELEGFLQAKAARVKSHEDRAVLQAHLRLEQGGDLLLGQSAGQNLRSLREGQEVEIERLSQYLLVEEPEGADILNDRRTG